MRKHFLAGGLALAAAFFPLTGCSQQAGSGAGASDSGTNATSSEASPAGLTVREGELRIGLDGNFAPFGFHDENGELVGFEKEIGDVIAQDLGLQAVFIESPWDSLIAGLDTNNYDVVINNLVPTAERKQKYDFSDIYYAMDTWIAVPEGSDIHAETDLAGKNCSQTASSNFADIVRDSGGTVVPATDLASSIELVRQGRAECTVHAGITLAYYLQQHPDSGLRLVPLPSVPHDDTAVMLKQGNPELREKINEVIANRLADGTFDAILAKYTPADWQATAKEQNEAGEQNEAASAN